MSSGRQARRKEGRKGTEQGGLRDCLSSSGGGSNERVQKVHRNMFRAAVFFHGLAIEVFGRVLLCGWLDDETAVGLAGCYNT